MNNEEVLKKMITKRTHALNQEEMVEIPCLHYEEEGLERLNPLCIGAREIGEGRVTYLTSVCEWMAGALAKVERLLRATRDRKFWRAIIANVLKGSDRHKFG